MTTIATWNCNMAFREKKYPLLEEDTDILVVPECENPETKGGWDEFTDWKWMGENDNKGLGVFTRNGISIESVTEIEGCRYAMAVRTNLLDLLAVWAMNEKRNPRQRYIGQVWTALQSYSDFVSDNAIVLGDFNWNIIWDESPKSPLCGNFSETVEELNKHGLRSVYHQVTGDEFGEEASPTLFMHKKEDRPYHTDYVFFPEAMLKSADISVGNYDEWIDASDHMPIIIDVGE
ncbi:endonuclease/exonuclease/phosphatase family protein [Halomicrobium sp. LC1Hm]|uniref:endonuclease/exonuclease/phosphatase family protein n=1 Tax=Halomicrobium sp. LC1Hm TaxID=2610902 RepID=UPI0012983FF4|nr:endonuclease/exonuclease/phosphatase family protein [Halomicrobium sp. LC1Hm]QGA81546.1 Exonuclease III [Halomicrobium sp. LC1Hm]